MATQTMVLLKNDQSKGLPITSPHQKACVSSSLSPLHGKDDTYVEQIDLYDNIYLQVVGPFASTGNLLFGDYSPIVMVYTYNYLHHYTLHRITQKLLPFHNTG